MAQTVQTDAVTTAMCPSDVTGLQVNVKEGVDQAGPLQLVSRVGILVLLKSKLFVVKSVIV